MMKNKDDSKVRQRICYQAFWKVFNSIGFVVTSPNICFLDALQNFMQSESADFEKDVFLIPESHFRNFILIAYS